MKEGFTMFDKAHERYKWIQHQVQTDGEYLHLMERLRQATPDFQAAMNALSQEQRDSVIEYLGICEELSQRTTEICCYMP